MSSILTQGCSVVLMVDRHIKKKYLWCHNIVQDFFIGQLSLVLWLWHLGSLKVKPGGWRDGSVIMSVLYYCLYRITQEASFWACHGGFLNWVEWGGKIHPVCAWQRFVEDLSLIPNTHIGQATTINNCHSREFKLVCWAPAEAWQTVHRHTDVYVYNNKINLKK